MNLFYCPCEWNCCIVHNNNTLRYNNLWYPHTLDRSQSGHPKWVCLAKGHLIFMMHQGKCQVEDIPLLFGKYRLQSTHVVTSRKKADNGSGYVLSKAEPDFFIFVNKQHRSVRLSGARFRPGLSYKWMKQWAVSSRKLAAIKLVLWPGWFSLLVLWTQWNMVELLTLGSW